LLLGDSGDGDRSQFVVVPPLLAEDNRAPTDFAVIVSDVVYPAGDVNEYADKFYLPYEYYRRPIYGVPGNHDWYDGLNGFMFHFCDVSALPDVGYRPASESRRARLVRRLWRRASRPKLQEMTALRESRPPWSEDETNLRPQPNSYFAIASETAGVVIVAIDTGISGRLDYEQAAWLIDVSSKPGAKILLTGKPLYVDNALHRGEITAVTGPGEKPLPGIDRYPEPFSGWETLTVEEIVSHKPFGYVATVGGDIHNYQRYEIPLPSGRKMHHFVNGGGGAYLSATHRFGMSDEADAISCRCRYPNPAESIEYYSRAATRTLPHLITMALTLACFGVVAATFVYPEGRIHAISENLRQLAALTAVLGLIALTPALIGRQWQLFLKVAAVAGGISLALELAESLNWSRADAAKLLLAAGGAFLHLQQLANAVVNSRSRGDTARSIAAFGFVVLLVVAVWAGAAWRGWGDPVWIGCVAAFIAPVIVVRLLPYVRNPTWAAAAWAAAGALAALLGLPSVVFFDGVPLFATVLVLWVLAAVLSIRIARTVAQKLRAALITAIVVGMTALVGLYGADPPFQAMATVLLVFLAGALLWYLVRIKALRVGLNPLSYGARFTSENAGRWLDNRTDPDVPKRERRVYKFVADLPREPIGGPLTALYSEFLDLDEPPFYKSFLRVDVTPKSVMFSPFKVSGRRGEPHGEPIEHPIEIQINGEP